MVFSFAGSQQLALQLEQGAGANVYASADQRWMAYAQEPTSSWASPQVFTHNRLVAIVPKTNPARIGGLADLARRGTKIVLAARGGSGGQVQPRGIAESRRGPGFPAKYDARVLANVVSQEDNVKGVVAKVQLGEADGGIVYRSDVTPAVSRYVRSFDIPDQYNVLASYSIAIVKGAKNQEAGSAFIALVLSAGGQAVLERNGLMALSAGETTAAPAARP